jgi:hypothetical protein
LAKFRLLKTFLSYQQVINNSHFSTQFFENLSADWRIFGTFAQLCKKLHNSLRNKEISQKLGEINSATAASLRNFGPSVIEKLSTSSSFLGES